MPGKKYQIFISSTYKDLSKERIEIIKTILDLDCIPCGMEMFPAIDKLQWEYIKPIMDDCDYYLLIIGGRYGSEDEDGVSYTEKEYEYAVHKGLKVIALIHNDPDSLERSKTETNKKAWKKLDHFRSKVMTSHLIKEWSSSKELPGLVAVSIAQAQKHFPMTGWIRGNERTEQHNQALSDLNDMQQLVKDLEHQTKEWGPVFKDFDACWSTIENTLSKAIVDARAYDEKVKVRILGVNLHYSLPALLKFCDSYDISGARIEIRMSILDPKCDLHKKLNEEWDHHSKLFDLNTKNFQLRCEQLENADISLKVHKYTHMPNWHGWSINSTEYFISSCTWDSKGKLTAGRNKYQHFSVGKGLMHNHMAMVYKRWFDYGRYHGSVNSEDALIFDTGS